MKETLVATLVVLWILGLIFHAGTFVHLLLAIPVTVLVFKAVRGRPGEL
jgi:hypothetical protein